MANVEVSKLFATLILRDKATRALKRMNKRLQKSKVAMDKLRMANKRLREGQTKLAKSSMSMSKAFRMFAGAAVTGIAIGAMVKFTKATIGLAAKMETIETGFKTLLGSAQKAKVLIKDLKEFSLATPFQPLALVKATETLLNFEVTAKDVLPTLRQLGDISGGNAQKLQSLAIAFGQVSSLGRLQGQDLLQMINVGFNPLSEIAKITGDSMSELRDKMTKGEIGIDLVRQAMVKATSKGGRFFERMKEGSKTTEGLTSTLLGFRDEVLETLGKEALPIVKELVGLMIEYSKATLQWLKVSENMQMVKDFISDIAVLLRAGAEFLAIAVKFTAMLSKGRRELEKTTAGRIFKRLTGGPFGFTPSLSDAASAGRKAGFGGARADGGPVTPGKSFLVGENGPELFAPNQSGNIIPKGGGGATLTFGNIIIQAGDGTTGRRMAKEFFAALNDMAPKLRLEAGLG